jgi:hypothetical protein
VRVDGKKTGQIAAAILIEQLAIRVHSHPRNSGPLLDEEEPKMATKKGKKLGKGKKLAVTKTLAFQTWTHIKGGKQG